MKAFKKHLLLATAGFTAINSASAGQFFVGSSLNIENNSFDFSLTQEQKEINTRVQQLLDEKAKLTLIDELITLEGEGAGSVTDNLKNKNTATDLMIKAPSGQKGITEILYAALDEVTPDNDYTLKVKTKIQSKIQAFYQQFTEAEQNEVYSDNFTVTLEEDIEDDREKSESDLTQAMANKINPIIEKATKNFFEGDGKVRYEEYIKTYNIWKTSTIRKGELIKLLKVTGENTTATIQAATTTEINKLKQTVSEDEQAFITEGKKSKTSPSLSLMAGYRMDVDNFGFITEVGTEIPFSSKVGSNSDGEIEMKKGMSFFLSQKLGYSFVQNNLTYLNLGLALTKYDVSNDYITDTSKTLLQPLVGAGHEFKINKTISLFTEFNFLFSGKFDVNDKTDTTTVGEIKVSSQQFKIGARYYF